MSIVKSFSFPCGELRGDTFYIRHNSNNFTVIDCLIREKVVTFRMVKLNLLLSIFCITK